MNGVTLRHLRYFAALARYGHFGRAAEACAVTQPALSVQIKELEALLGAPLVERGGRGLRLTGLGAVFAERARAILREVDDLGDIARAARGEIVGPIRIGFIPTIAPYLLPACLTALAAAQPEADLRPREAVTGTLLNALAEGTLDAAVLALPASEPSLHEEPLIEEEFVLVRPHAEADAPVPGVADLAGARLLLLEEGHCFRDQALAFCAPVSAGPGDLIEGSSLATLVQMVGAGLGLTLVPEMAVRLETPRAPVAVQRLNRPRPVRTVGMVWRRTTPLAAPLARIAAIFRKAARDQASSGA
jgi:LysR family hydrogen peroxide-inducible transcriptional activator